MVARVIARILHGHDADGRFQPVAAGFDAAQMRQRHGQADGPMAAHAQHADVVEKDHAGDAARRRSAPAAALRPITLEPRGSLTTIERNSSNRWRKISRRSCMRALAQVGSAGDHDAGRLAAGMRIDHLDAAQLSSWQTFYCAAGVCSTALA